MDREKKDNLYKFFNICFVTLLVIYISFNVILIFSISVSTDIIACVSLVLFFLIIMRNAINEKFSELEDVAGSGILSVSSLSIAIACCCAVRVYYLRIEQWDTILWSSLALYVSIPLDQSIRALHKLKQECQQE